MKIMYFIKEVLIIVLIITSFCWHFTHESDKNGGAEFSRCLDEAEEIIEHI